jgi:hypothetical protein
MPELDPLGLGKQTQVEPARFCAIRTYGEAQIIRSREIERGAG